MMTRSLLLQDAALNLQFFIQSLQNFRDNIPFELRIVALVYSHFFADFSDATFEVESREDIESVRSQGSHQFLSFVLETAVRINEIGQALVMENAIGEVGRYPFFQDLHKILGNLAGGR